MQQGPMSGIRVVELAAWVAGPAVATILADWGADVIKIEPPTGDPFRYMVNLGTDGLNPAFELDNRGKRSLGLDVATAGGRDVLLELLGTADVFVSNLRPAQLRSLRLEPEPLLQRFPTLVVATINGFGHNGPDADRPSYDMGGFWSRTGMAGSHIRESGEPTVLRGAIGDHLTALALTAGVAAALHDRTRTGRGTHVTSSLLRGGLYALGQDANITVRTGITFPAGRSRTMSSNPLYNHYRTGDGRWLWLLGLQSDRSWPPVAVALGHPEWLDDERFGSAAARSANNAELIALMDDAFAERSLAEWTEILEDLGVWWEPVVTLPEALAHPQTIAANAVIEIPGRRDGTIPAIAAPVDFDGERRVRDARGVPGFGDDTDDVLAELGRSPEQIAAMRRDCTAY